MNEHLDTEHSALAPDSETSPDAAELPDLAAPLPPDDIGPPPKTNPTLGDVYDLLWQNRQDETANRRKQLELYGQVRGDLDAARGEVRSLMARVSGIDTRLTEGDTRFGQIEMTHVEALDRVSVVLGKIQLRLSDGGDELRGMTVLIVEDDPAVRTLVDRICRRASATTIPVATTADALAALTKINAPAAATVDILLGAGGDGLALARHLATQRQDIGVVLLTGGLTDRYKREFEAMGVRVLGKPFDADALVSALAEARNAARP